MKFVQNIYNKIPLKLEVFSIMRSIYVPPPVIYKRLYFSGVFKTKCDEYKFKMRYHAHETDTEIFWRGITGGRDKVSLGLWRNLCRTAKVIVDIGANTGVYSLVAQTVNASSKVFAFEPVPTVYKMLMDNVKLNDYNVDCKMMVVSNYDGTAKVIQYPVIDPNEPPDPAAPAAADQEVQVDTTKLSTFIERYHIKSINLLKVVNSAKVLEGFGKYLDAMRPSMLVEVFSDEAGRKVQQLVDGKGYLYFNLNETGPIRQVPDIKRSDTTNFLICNTAVATACKIL